MESPNNVRQATFGRDQVKPEGPLDADIVIVGEAPGETEVRMGVPFVGASGQELDRMLHEAGILRSDCFLTNVARQRPNRNQIDSFYVKKTDKERVPGPVLENGIRALHQELLTVRPRVIIALGDTPLWALTGETGITKWRGSELTYTHPEGNFTCTLIPTYHPAAILRMWSWRFSGLIDLRRAKRVCDTLQQTNSYLLPPRGTVHNIRPSFETAMGWLSDKRLRTGIHGLDIETRAGHIACVGFSLSQKEACCIPFMCVERDDGYWSFEEEVAIVNKFREVFRYANTKWVLQNGLFDLQYFARYWGVIPRVWMDTMLVHHVCFAGLPKGLDFLSSIYCERHVYWKDDGKTWDKHTGEDQLWTYNCDDCTATQEVAERLDAQVDRMGLRAQADFQMRQFYAVLTMMLRGVRCDLDYRQSLITTIDDEVGKHSEWLSIATRGKELYDASFGSFPTKKAQKEAILRGRFNVKSTKQKKEFFYEELGIKEIRNRKTGSVSTDDATLDRIVRRRPLLKPLVTRMQLVSSLRTVLSNHVLMKLDRDGRIRSSFNIAGTETYRYSSSQNAFGSGTNLQNVPNPKKDPDLPNIRSMFIPDPGYELAGVDLDRADLQVVAWEAEDEELKQMLREGADIHLENAKVFFGDQSITEDSPLRDLSKAGVHATNYYAKPTTLAATLGITVRQAERNQRRWFAAHPGIPEWHNRVENDIQTTRRVANKFGFIRYYFERIEGVLPEALAWVPQSTVALVVCRGLLNIHTAEPGTALSQVQPLIQVHDELLVQYPKHLRNPCLQQIKSAMEVTIPYDDPLIIPVGPKISDKSWGELTNYTIPEERSYA